jgi:TDG/mug DNA glycosylase family protein
MPDNSMQRPALRAATDAERQAASLRMVQHMGPRLPTRNEIRAAAGRRIPDLLQPGLRVLFCGINPGLYSAAVGQHFARPGNRFWRTLHAAGFTKGLLAPMEGRTLLRERLGITDLVARATATADQLSRDELIRGRHRLARKVRRYAPQWVAVLGLGAYRTAFEQPKASIGPQELRLGQARLWVLPNPSGLNAGFPSRELARAFRALRRAVWSRAR